MAFTRAQRHQTKLRMALMGPTGSGKTYSMLAIAAGLGQRVAVIDTEGRAQLYAAVDWDNPKDGEFCFDHDRILPPYHPDTFVNKIREAESFADVICIDSGTHEWSGEGGCLDIKSEIEAKHRAKSGKELGFAAFKEITPLHNRFVQAIVGCKAHVILTLRSKQEYVIEGGKPRKIGLAPDARPDTEYEFDIVGALDQEHTLWVEKSRYAKFADQRFKKPGREFGRELVTWLNSGAPEEPKAPPPPPVVVDWEKREAEACALLDAATTSAEMVELRAKVVEAFPKDGTPAEVRKRVGACLTKNETRIRAADAAFANGQQAAS